MSITPRQPALGRRDSTSLLNLFPSALSHHPSQGTRMAVHPPPHRFDLINDANHPVILVNGCRVCLDTGSPFTFRHPKGPESFRIFDRDMRLHDIPMSQGCMEDGLESLGFHFDVLLGMDLMADLSWRLDWGAGTAEAAPALPEEEGTTWLPMPPSLGMSMSCPSCRVGAGREVALFDTGAQLSYRIGTKPITAQPAGESRDFNPHLGIFETPVWEDDLAIADHPFPVRFGQLPQLGAVVLEAMGVSWILGSDLLHAFRMTLDFPGHRLGLRLQKKSQ